MKFATLRTISDLLEEERQKREASFERIRNIMNEKANALCELPKDAPDQQRAEMKDALKQYKELYEVGRKKYYAIDEALEDFTDHDFR